MVVIFDICHCGRCNEIVWGGRQYIHGHNGVHVKHNNSGENNPFFGKHHTEETLELISNNCKGRIPWNKGKCNIYSDETLKLISESGKGRIPPNKGIPWTDETKKKISDSRKGILAWNKGLLGYNCGVNHWNYQNGISFEPYCEKFNFKKKEEIRNRDNRICQECNKTELENGKRLDVHHVHYDKPNCDPDLISLCHSCNLKANINRNYWEEHFMKKLEERNLLNWRN